MPEKLNNNNEQMPDEGAAEATEYPAFDPKAAEEARQKAIAEYEASHPDAVKDIDKARYMAETEDPYRTKAAAYRETASDFQERAMNHLLASMDNRLDEDSRRERLELANSLKDTVIMNRLAAKEHDETADAEGKKVGDFYDSMNNSPYKTLDEYFLNQYPKNATEQAPSQPPQETQSPQPEGDKEKTGLFGKVKGFSAKKRK